MFFISISLAKVLKETNNYVKRSRREVIRLMAYLGKLSPEVQAALIAAAVTIILAAAKGVFDLIRWIHNPGMQKARKKLHYDIKRIHKEQRKEGLFFNESSKLKRKFISAMTIGESGSRNRTFRKTPRLRGSYLITGEAGCGKTAMLQNTFHKSFTKQCLFRLFRQTRESYYFEAGSLIRILTSKASKKEFLDRIAQADLSCLTLYVDGVDELSEAYIGQFLDFIHDINRQVEKLVLRFSCRTEFANKHLSEYSFDSKLNVEKWNQTQLKKLARSILKVCKHEKQFKSRLAEIKEYLENAEFPWNFINSPLLLKMLLYIKLYGNHRFLVDTNKYSFYTAFFLTLITIYKGKARKGFRDLEKQIDEAAAAVFQAYSKHEKSIIYMDFLYPLIKPVPDHTIQKVCLSHETFYEYLVARHYHNQYLKKAPSVELVDVMKNVYSNDYADFITAAFAEDQEKQQISAMNIMCALYGYTLLSEQEKIFQSKFIPNYKYDKKLKSYIAKVEKNVNNEQNSFLTLKNEIIFRFGRFPENVNKSFRINFLEFIYFNDTNVGTISDKNYYIAILKRGCAISASFLGGEKVELDYIENMLDFKPYRYNREYDLANRSHTLVYYADIPNSNIYTFKDTEAECSWTYARSKRINRLSYPLPDRISEMNEKERKKYYFRAFDIATIYTFLRSRPYSKLSSEEIDILSNFKIDFEDMSEERRNLLRALKSETLRLTHNM